MGCYVKHEGRSEFLRSFLRRQHRRTHLHAPAPRGAPQALVETPERHVTTGALELDGRREMHRIVSAEAVMLGERTGSPHEGLGYVHDGVRGPVFVEVLDRLSKLATVEATLAALPCKRRARLGAPPERSPPPSPGRAGP
jgi:hypothetical protein